MRQENKNRKTVFFKTFLKVFDLLLKRCELSHHHHRLDFYPVVNSLTHSEPEFTVETKPYLAPPHLASFHSHTLPFSSIYPPISAVDCWFCFVVAPVQQKVDEWELQPAFLFLHITRYRWSRKQVGTCVVSFVKKLFFSSRFWWEGRLCVSALFHCGML